MTNSPLSTGQKIARLALVGMVPLALIIVFLWAGGWLAPQRLSADKLVTALQQSGGEHPGYRRNHAKGVCFIGEFRATGNASAFSRAPLFAQGA
ncbi:MAG TPA: catalase, partial [Pantoea septica]|nr:catalase [Pantoea septica]